MAGIRHRRLRQPRGMELERVRIRSQVESRLPDAGDVKLAEPCRFIVSMVKFRTGRAKVRRSFITTTVRDETQVTPQGRHR